MSDKFAVAVVQNLIQDALIIGPPRRRRPNYFNIEDAFEISDSEFKKHFRLTKNLTIALMNMVEPVLENRTHVDLKTKVLCALHFFGTGSYQTPVGNMRLINVSQPTTSRCISEIVEALNHPNIFNEWVKFPGSIQELNSIAREFYRMYHFPGVIGCIDCTHVAIVPPCPPFDEQAYVNRKNYHSINTQLICDASLKILNANALFSGSTHDCFIWNNSRMLPFLENLHAAGHNNYHQLGDSGYPLRPWCLTPILEAEEGSAEFRYTEALKKTRATIERCNGVLKGRFRCLLKDRVLHYAPNKGTKIINACCVLHNLCITHGYYGAINAVDEENLGVIDPIPLDQVVPVIPSRHNLSLMQGREKQNAIVNRYFNE